jgi:hypothetical protein
MAAALLMTGLSLTGCYESSTDLNNNQGDNRASIDLTIAEVITQLKISDEQASALAPALDAWRQGRAAGEPQERGALRMLASASDVLDRDQLLGLVTMLQEKRQATFQKRGRRGPNNQRGTDKHHGKRGDRRNREGRDGGALQELGLDENQLAALKAARQEMHAASKALFEQRRAGTLSKEDLHAAMQPLKEQMQTSMQAILTAEQLAQWNERRNASTLSRLEKSAQRIDDHGRETLSL